MAPQVCKTATSCRWLLSYVCCLGFLFVYAFRVNMSVAIVCMTVPVNSTSKNDSDPEGCGKLDSTSKPQSSNEFTWDKELQGLILSSFFIGYIVTQIPGGWLSVRFGGKHVHGMGMLISVIANMFIPLAARSSVGLLIFLRVVIGLGTGVAFPSCHAIWARWAPPLERSKLIALSQSGSMLGSITAMIFSGLLCASGVDRGWPLIFYVFGGATFLWWILWMFLAYSTPDEHPRISEEERDYIITSIGPSVSKEMVPTPWLQFLKSPPVWAICIAHVCNNWGNYTLITSMPMYMKEVLKFDIRQNGFLSALPYLVMFIMATLGGHLADFIRSRKILSTTYVRKIFQCVAFLVPAILLIIIGFIGCKHRGLAVGILTLAVAFNGISRCAFSVNHVDIAPRFAGILYGISNTLGTLPGIFAPMVVGIITKKGTREEWQKIFFICSAFYVVGAVLFFIMAKGEEQHWAKMSSKSADIKKAFIEPATTYLSDGSNVSQKYILNSSPPTSPFQNKKEGYSLGQTITDKMTVLNKRDQYAYQTKL